MIYNIYIVIFFHIVIKTQGYINSCINKCTDRRTYHDSISYLWYPRSALFRINNLPLYTALEGPQPVSQAANISIAAPGNHQAAANYQVAASNHQPGSIPSQHFSNEEKHYIEQIFVFTIYYTSYIVTRSTRTTDTRLSKITKNSKPLIDTWSYNSCNHKKWLP